MQMAAWCRAARVTTAGAHKPRCSVGAWLLLLVLSSAVLTVRSNGAVNPKGSSYEMCAPRIWH